jgi:SRSO17 transposase
MLGVSYLPSHIHRGVTAIAAVFTDSRNVESFEALVSALIVAEANWTITGLTSEISRQHAKSRRAYDDFLGTANWPLDRLAQQLVEYFCEECDIGDGDELLLHIDDTFVAKTGDATDGVGRFRNPCTGKIEWGNVFVTSCLQAGETVVPYRARMYLAEQAAADLDEPFKKKTDIALEEIIRPLQLPVGAALTVVFDSAYYRSDIITAIQQQGGGRAEGFS